MPAFCQRDKADISQIEKAQLICAMQPTLVCRGTGTCNEDRMLCMLMIHNMTQTTSLQVSKLTENLSAESAPGRSLASTPGDHMAEAAATQL